jgi:Predicted transcriptional regulator
MFSSNINKVLLEKKMKPIDLARQSGISRQAIHKARQDAGISECRLSTLGRIAEALGVSTKELYEESREGK